MVSHWRLCTVYYVNRNSSSHLNKQWQLSLGSIEAECELKVPVCNFDQFFPLTKPFLEHVVYFEPCITFNLWNWVTNNCVGTYCNIRFTNWSSCCSNFIASLNRQRWHFLDSLKSDTITVIVNTRDCPWDGCRVLILAKFWTASGVASVGHGNRVQVDWRSYIASTFLWWTA